MLQIILDGLCHRDYFEKLAASFYHQIQSEYCSGNRSVSIEVISLEHLSVLPETDINSSTKSFPHYSVYPFFLSNDRK